MYAAILAGGVGTRLWPRSRQALPKQFTDITGAGRTMIQATVDRIADIISPDRTYIITGSRYRSLIVEQLPHLPEENILVEPSGRNTAPAVGLACTHLHKRDPEGVVAILSADHVIRDEEMYRAVLQQAQRAAQAGYLTVLGIEPDSPQTGYGYIKRTGSPLDVPGALPVYTVERFLEKPNLDTAIRFLEDGGYYWNGGTFVSRVDLLLAEMERQMPDMYGGLTTIQAALGTDQESDVLQTVWPTLPRTSIDYGVMEDANRVAVVPLDAGWNDVGSWDAIEAVMDADDTGNCMVQGDVIVVGSKGNIISANDRTVALVGVEDLVIVETDDALLVGHKSQMQEVKTLVNLLRERRRADLL